MNIVRIYDGNTTEECCGKLNFDISVLKMKEIPSDYDLLRQEFSGMVRYVVCDLI